jgi:hypothetical protein
MTVLIGTAALANHPEASLAGSTFEIDVDANLKVDDTSPSLDWANVTETRATDAVNGTGDNSYAGGVKEDTVCPGTTTDSIPPNKSDLLSFHVYREAGSGSHPGFLNVAWSRVSEPSGTTLMDFEFNQSSTTCANSPNKVRTVGDLLIEYAIDQGGSRADITARTWMGTAWGPTTDLDAPSATCGGAPCASGTINTSLIPAAESDGLITTGSKQARTFGEAQIDLRLVFQPNRCASFGSAMLKSRSSDSFTSQLKDFVAPVGINLQNCAQVIIRKQTDPDGATASFRYTHNLATDPALVDNAGTTTINEATQFDLQDGGSRTSNGVLFGSGYSVTEALPTGWTFDHIDCDASVGVTPTIDAALRKVTFDLDDSTDVVDCTYYNEARGSIVIEKVTAGGFGGPFPFSSNPDLPSPATAGDFSLTTVAADTAVSATFSNLVAGSSYAVTEGTVAGWNLSNIVCSGGTFTIGADGDYDAGDTTATITVPAGGTVTCRYTNTKQGSIVIEKVTTGGFGGPFAFASNPDLPSPATAGDFSLTTTAAGAAGKVSQTFSNLVAGSSYAVTESVLAGWDLTNIACTGGAFTIGADGDYDAGDTTATITVPVGGTVTCTFTNTREFRIIVITCNEQTNGLVDSTVSMSGTDKQTITAVPTALANKGVTMADLCGIGGAFFADLAQGNYGLTVEVPDLAPLFPN